MSRWEGFEEFVEVVKCGTFSAAAKSLGVSKAHVSQQVSRLEDHLSTRLLHRTTRKVSLSETGQIYYDYCRQVIEDLEMAELAVTNLQEEVRGLIRISSPHLLGEEVLIPALASFQKLHSKLEIEIDLNSHKVDLIAERYDLAIQLGERKDINVVNYKLAQTQFHVVASPGYLKNIAKIHKPEDLRKHDCLLFQSYGQVKPWKFKKGNETLSIDLKSHWRSNSGHALRSAARQGLGLAYLPGYYLRNDFANKQLINVLPKWQSIDRSLVAIYQHKRHVSLKIRTLTQFLKQYLEDNGFANAER